MHSNDNIFVILTKLDGQINFASNSWLKKSLKNIIQLQDYRYDWLVFVFT